MAIKREKNSYINAAGASHIGQVRQANQDNYASRAGVHVLADGMGGHQGGEVASLEATSTILESGKISSIAEMVKSVSKANQAIIKRAKKDETLSGMGTTVCVLTEILGSDGEIKIGIANVGDSRVYRLGNSELTQVTLDHSLVADLVRAGELTQEEASRHPQRNILTRALGIEQDLVIDTWELPLVTSDRYLLCSDGLFNEIDDEKIAEILMADEELGKIAENLVINALEAGGNDNITALVVSVVEETEFENENWVLNEMIPYPAVKPLLNPSIDKEIRKLVDEGYNTATKILTEKVDDLHKIAKALITYETLTGEEIENIINKNLYPKDKMVEKLEENDDQSSALGAMGLKPKIVH